MAESSSSIKGCCIALMVTSSESTKPKESVESDKEEGMCMRYAYA